LPEIRLYITAYPSNFRLKAPSGDAGESLPRERSECFGYNNDFDNTTGINTSIAIGADSFPVISYQEASSPPFLITSCLLFII